MKDHIVNQKRIKNDKTNLDGISSYISSQFNINSTTKYPHTEFDQSSTIIFVPNQAKSHGNFLFEFRFNYFVSIRLNLQPGISLIYSAYLLVHRQISTDIIISEKKSSSKNGNKLLTNPNTSNNNGISDYSKKENFINISFYFNERLFNNIRKSYIRETGNQCEPGNKKSTEVPK